MANTVNITNTNNTVTVTPQSNNSVSSNNTNTSVSVTQETTSIVTVNTVGPQGPKGASGESSDASNFNSLNTFTGSIQTEVDNLTASTSSYLTGADTGSFIINSQTGSFVTNSQTSSMSVNSASYANSASYILGSNIDGTVSAASVAALAVNSEKIDINNTGNDQIYGLVFRNSNNNGYQELYADNQAGQPAYNPLTNTFKSYIISSSNNLYVSGNINATSITASIATSSIENFPTEVSRSAAAAGFGTGGGGGFTPSLSTDIEARNITASGNISASGDLIANNSDFYQLTSSLVKIGILDRPLSIQGGWSFSATYPKLTPGGGILNIDGGVNIMGEYKLSFDNDTTNTYIKANSDNPEDLEIHADQDILLFPDGQVTINSNISASGDLIARSITGSITTSSITDFPTEVSRSAAAAGFGTEGAGGFTPSLSTDIEARNITSSGVIETNKIVSSSTEIDFNSNFGSVGLRVNGGDSYRFFNTAFRPNVAGVDLGSSNSTYRWDNFYVNYIDVNGNISASGDLTARSITGSIATSSIENFPTEVSKSAAAAGFGTGGGSTDISALNNFTSSIQNIQYIFSSSTDQGSFNLSPGYIHEVEDSSDYLYIHTESYNNIDIANGNSIASSNFFFKDKGSIVTLTNPQTGAFKKYKVIDFLTSQEGIAVYNIQLNNAISSGSLNSGDIVNFEWDKDATPGTLKQFLDGAGFIEPNYVNIVYSTSSFYIPALGYNVSNTISTLEENLYLGAYIATGSNLHINKITASSDISASGTITGNNLTVNNNLTVGSDVSLGVGSTIYDNNDVPLIGINTTNLTLGTSTHPLKILSNVTASGNISSSNTIYAKTGSFSHLEGNSPITVKDTITFQGAITASNISASGDIFGNSLVLNGGTFTSSSLAAAIGGGGDNLGNHTAETDLNMANNNIVSVGNVDGVDISTLKSDFDTLEGKTLISSSDQILPITTASITNFPTEVSKSAAAAGFGTGGTLTDISSLNTFTGSIQTEVDSLVAVTSSYALTSSISGAFAEPSGGFSTRITTLETAGYLTESPFTALGITGSFNELSASLSTRFRNLETAGYLTSPIATSSITDFNTEVSRSAASAGFGTGGEGGFTPSLSTDIEARNITASIISSSGNLLGNGLILAGGNDVFTSASLAAAIAGGDNLGNHTATENLNLDGNSIHNALHITASGTINADEFNLTGAGVPTLTSNTNLNLSASNAVVIKSPIFRLTPTTTGSILSAQNGDIVYDYNDHTFYGYADGSWVALH